jgi:hypothetical protein
MDRQWATTNDRVWQAVKEHLGAERFAAAHELGGRLSLDDAAAEAMTDGVGAADHAGGRAVETAPSNGRVRSV